MFHIGTFKQTMIHTGTFKQTMFHIGTFMLMLMLMFVQLHLIGSQAITG